MTINRRILTLALMFGLAATLRADEAANYFAAPIATELHRVTVSANADAYVIVHCNALIVDGELDLAALDEEGFVATLSDVTPDRSHLRLVCRFQFPSNVESPLRKRLNDRLKELSRSAGFKRISLSETMTSADWKDAYQRADAFQEPDDAREPMIENEHVRVFPVRTRLSKLVHGETDCIVDVVRPIDGRRKGIPADLASSIREAVREAEPSEKHTLLFKLSSTAAGREKVEKLFDARSKPRIPETSDPALLEIFAPRVAAFQPSPALALAQELGFQRILYTHSPGGGAPETLVGAKAPDFDLTRLNGDRLVLQDFIHGRPALITFWGLACAPCRKEAPHLSALHKKYGQRFSIVAVNGYDDAREPVAEYVKNENLSHPIALQGKTVSDDLYRVGAYPTSFWVDSEGTIVDYDVGFTSSKRLADRVEGLVNH